MTAVPKPQYYTVDEYLALPEAETDRTELIYGEIVGMGAPTLSHQELSYGLHRTIDDHIRANHGNCKVHEAAGVRLHDETLVIPVLMVVCDPDKLKESYCIGAPDWIIEILSTNRSHDLRTKLGLYQDAGVREYWIVDPKNEKTLVYHFERSDFPAIYTFDTPIPVGIYGGALSIRIADLLG